MGAVVAVLAVIAVLLTLLAGRNAGKKVSLYYVDPASFRLVQVQQTVEGAADVPAALTLLFQGQASGLENLFPQGVTVLGSSVQGKGSKKELVVDLSSNFLSVNYGVEVNNLLVMSVVYTAADASGIDKVRLLFDGQARDFFHDGVYLGEAMKRDPDVLK